MRRRLLPLALVAGCGAPVSDGSDLAAPPADLAADAGVADLALVDQTRRTVSGTWRLTLDAGAYPPTTRHPSAVVFIPTGFDPTPPLSVIVYFHGFNNCVENIIGDQNGSCDPDAGTPLRNAYSLAAQLEAAHKNAILLCPELVFDQATGAPGALGNTNGFRTMLVEVLGDLPELSAQLDDVGPVVVASHSGGYQAAAALLSRGGVPIVETWLLDSLYGNFTDYDTWVKQDLPSLAGPSPSQRRFADVYTSGGGTLTNSQNMATRAAGWVGADAGILVDDRTTSTWPPDTYGHGLLFKHSALSHDDVPRYYFERLVRSSSLPDLP